MKTCKTFTRIIYLPEWKKNFPTVFVTFGQFPLQELRNLILQPASAAEEPESTSVNFPGQRRVPEASVVICFFLPAIEMHNVFKEICLRGKVPDLGSL